ncbi:MAG: hypothetical protein J6T10_01785 [Methanobrevibacter sp.]|nr:hypothetical protein [Methanobrevibacter sp.]
MASQAIKKYDDFAGQDGYVIVDGIDDQTPGGKKLLSTIGGGGGGASYTVETISGPFPLNQYYQMVVTLPDNHKVYNITNVHNESASDICIVAPTVSNNEVVDVYVNIEIPNSDEDSHYIMVQDMQRMSDGDCDGSYSTADRYDPVFMHIFYKYYTICHTSDE